MIQKKICMIGASGVGKTSLVSRFVSSLFSEKYLTTVGVKVDKKIVSTPAGEVTMMIWDLAGVDELQMRLPVSYFRGTSGCLLVADGTRRATLDTALELQQSVRATVGAVPFVLVLNKCDLQEQWEIGDAPLNRLGLEGCTLYRTSAKTGEGVESAFVALARLMVV
jgi:small GTP-binding protein